MDGICQVPGQQFVDAADGMFGERLLYDGPYKMPEPITTVAILKQLKDAVPLIKSGWAKVIESDEHDAGSRLILFMEGKRIFDYGSFEVPYACYKSSENIVAEVEKERAKLPNDAFKKRLLDLIDVCNRFKTSLDKMNLSENKQWATSGNRAR